MTTHNTPDKQGEALVAHEIAAIKRRMLYLQSTGASDCGLTPWSVLRLITTIETDRSRASVAAVGGDAISRADALRVIQDARERGNADLRELVSELKALPAAASDGPICVCAITPSERCPIHAALVTAAASSPAPAEPPPPHVFNEDCCMFCGGKTAHKPDCSHGLTRFKVGDRLRNIHASYLPIATVTEFTPHGFKYELERPLVVSPRLGTQVGGESYDDSQWEEVAAPAEPVQPPGEQESCSGCVEVRAGVRQRCSNHPKVRR